MDVAAAVQVAGHNSAAAGHTQTVGHKLAAGRILVEADRSQSVGRTLAEGPGHIQAAVVRKRAAVRN